MKVLPVNATDDDLLQLVHDWVRLLEAGRYEEAFELTDHVPSSGWTPTLIKQCIEGYDEALPNQHVTLQGVANDIIQHIEVSRWISAKQCFVGDIWYDLNINNVVSDLTATFYICESLDGLYLSLNDIHVM